MPCCGGGREGNSGNDSLYSISGILSGVKTLHNIIRKRRSQIGKNRWILTVEHDEKDVGGWEKQESQWDFYKTRTAAAVQEVSTASAALSKTILKFFTHASLRNRPDSVAIWVCIIPRWSRGIEVPNHTEQGSLKNTEGGN